MAHLNFSDFYQVPNLKFDVNKMRSDLNKILEKKGFKSPEGVTNFGAIPLNQIPNDENSIKGNNIRGIYWTIPDEKGKEVARDIPIDGQSILKLFQSLKILTLMKFIIL